MAFSVARADKLHLHSFEYWYLQDRRPCFEPPPHTLDLFAAVHWMTPPAVDGRMNVA